MAIFTAEYTLRRPPPPTAAHPARADGRRSLYSVVSRAAVYSLFFVPAQGAGTMGGGESTVKHTSAPAAALSRCDGCRALITRPPLQSGASAISSGGRANCLPPRTLHADGQFLYSTVSRVGFCARARCGHTNRIQTTPDTATKTGFYYLYQCRILSSTVNERGGRQRCAQLQNLPPPSAHCNPTAAHRRAPCARRRAAFFFFRTVSSDRDTSTVHFLLERSRIPPISHRGICTPRREIEFYHPQPLCADGRRFIIFSRLAVAGGGICRTIP